MNTDPKSAYRDAAVQTATPVRRVVLLYEQIIQDLQRAAHALRQGEAERRCHEIDHALVVIGQLQMSLDMERGGEVALNLERFYKLLRANLMEAQFQGSQNLLEQQIAHLLSVREAWTEVERVTGQEGKRVAPPASPAAPQGPPVDAARVNWSA